MSDESRDYYSLLHVSRNAPTEVIQASYRTMMQKLKMHPDLGGDSIAAALLNEAYAVLTDDEKRAAYDATLPPAEVTAETLAQDMPVPEPPAEAPQRPLDPSRECVFCFMPHDHGRSIFREARCVVCKSPLYIADQKRLETNDTRAVARIAKQQDVEFYTNWPQAMPFPGRTEDISLHGLRLVCGQPLQRDQLLKIRCPQFEAVAQVVMARQEQRGARTYWIAGLTFITLLFNRSVGGFVSDRA